MERYSKQVLFEPIGEQGQLRLAASRAVVVGCGALGTNLSEKLVRAGVGQVRIVDRDRPELSNLQRQVLFDESDVLRGAPKCEAAAARLAQINSEVTVEALHVELGPHNALELLSGADVVLDGLDNLLGRYVVNDACAKLGIPWIYGGVVGSSGMSMLVRPGSGPCLRCLFPEPPLDGSLPTADTNGIINTIPAVIAAVAVTDAIKLLVGQGPPATESSAWLLRVDLWHGLFERLRVERDPACQTCAGRYDYLQAEGG